MTTISPGSTSRTKLGVDEVQGAGFARQHPGAVNSAQAQRAEAVRVAHADQLVLGHDDQRIGALDATKGLQEVVALAARGRLGQEVQDDLAVHRGLEDRAFGLQLLAKLGGVGQVAVVGDGDLAAGAIHRERLGVAQVRGAGRGIARVADGDGAGQVVQDAALEDLRHQAHAFVGVELPAVRGDDARAFLAAVLQGVEAVVGQLRRRSDGRKRRRRRSNALDSSSSIRFCFG